MLQLMSNWLICIDCRWQGRKRDGIRRSVDAVQFGLDYCCWRWVLQYMQCRLVIFSFTRDDGNNDFLDCSFVCLGKEAYIDFRFHPCLKRADILQHAIIITIQLVQL